MTISRVLVLPLNYDHPQLGQEKAFRALFPSVEVFDYLEEERRGASASQVNQRFIDVATAFDPDWIWMQVQDTNVITADAVKVVRDRLGKTVITHWTGDARPNLSPYLSSVCKATHLTLTSCAGHIDRFKAAGADRVEYLQIGLDEDEDLAGNPPWDPPFRIPDVVFCGNHYGDVFPGTGLRVAAVDALRMQGIDIGVVGSGWPSGTPVIGTCHVKQQVHVYRKAKVALSINHYNDIERYYSDRQLIAMASGTATACVYIPGLEQEFKSGEHCVWFRNTDELVGAVRRLLGDDALRARIGAAGKAEVSTRHTWTSRIRGLSPRIEQLRS